MPKISQDSHKFEWLTARGWHLLPCHPHGATDADGRPLNKTPIGKLVPNGVYGATTDMEVIAAWLAEYPDANWAVACGHPGPQVLDIDNPGLVPRALLPILRSAPKVRTGRGGHVYFQGTAAPTVRLDYGELLGVGGYSMIPPSVHHTGKPYLWEPVPNGPLPKVPVLCARTERSNGAGRGEHVAPVGLVPYGQRHEYLRAFVVHLLRGGLVDAHLIECHLRCEFDRICEPLPSPKPGDFLALARWAVQSRIAERERRNGR